MFIMATLQETIPLTKRKYLTLPKKERTGLFNCFLSKRLFEMLFGLTPLTDNVKHEKTDLMNLVEKRKMNAKGGSNVTFAIVVC